MYGQILGYDTHPLSQLGTPEQRLPLKSVELLHDKQMTADDQVLSDVVTCHESLTFAWTALSGFQSTGYFILFMSLIFAWIALSGFQSTETLFFCLSRPFGFST